MDRRFFHRLGASQLRAPSVREAGEDGISRFRAKMGTEPEQFRHSKIHHRVGREHSRQQRSPVAVHRGSPAQGRQLVVIDPYRTRTAACADWHMPINPGTDVALALGMMHVIINEKLHDRDYVARYTLGFEQLRTECGSIRRSGSQPLDRNCGLGHLQLAREYATTRPAAIRLNYGVQRSENGGMAVRAITMLPCITGSWKEVGGGLQLSTSGAYPLNERVWSART